MSRNILIVSTTPFFGGGENFVSSVLAKIDGACFLVRDSTLASRLAADRCMQFSSDNIWVQYREIRQALRIFQPKIVIFNGGRSMYFTLLFRKPYRIVYRHTTNQSVLRGLKRWIYIVLLHLCYAAADKVIHVSKFALQQQKCCRKKAVAIHNGLPEILQTKIRREIKGPLRVLFVGRLERAKGLCELVEAVKGFSPNQLVLDVVGAGPLSEWMQTQNPEQFHYYGFQQNVSPFYQQADIFCLLSYYENCPLSIIDALRWSLPVIATPVGGIPEMVQNDLNGKLVPVKEVREVQNALKILMENAALREKMGDQSKKIFLQEYTEAHTLDQIQTLLASSPC